MKKNKKPALHLAETALKKHFSGHKLHDLVTASRTFPVTARVDLNLPSINCSASAPMSAYSASFDNTATKR
jgi:hypothetical protein